MSLNWYELIQAKTMIPVFLVHMMQSSHVRSQSVIGMMHSFISYLLHMSCWWWHQQDELIILWLYIADKCFILLMMWGFHYHFEPISAKRMAFPILWDIFNICRYQHQYYLETRIAYFDIVLLIYTLYVCLLICSYMKKMKQIGFGTMLFLSIFGYGINIQGLMHLCLAPGFCLLYEEIKEEKNKKKIIVTNKKEHEL